MPALRIIIFTKDVVFNEDITFDNKKEVIIENLALKIKQIIKFTKRLKKVSQKYTQGIDYLIFNFIKITIDKNGFNY